MPIGVRHSHWADASSSAGSMPSASDGLQDGAHRDTMTRREGPPTGSHVRLSSSTSNKSIYMNVAWKQEDLQRIIDQSSIIEPGFDSIREALQVICDPGDVHEVRVLDTNLGI